MDSEVVNKELSLYMMYDRFVDFISVGKLLSSAGPSPPGPGSASAPDPLPELTCSRKVYKAIIDFFPGTK